MSLQEIIEKIINGLKTRTATVTVQHQFSDDLGLKYKFGEITLLEFISKITDDLPYTIFETYENNFFISNKNTKYPFNNYVNPNSLGLIWEDEVEAKFINAYPELEKLYKNSKAEIKNASCSTCSKNGKIYGLLNEFMFISHENRDNKFLINLYGARFYEQLLANKPQQRPQMPKQNQPQQQQRTQQALQTPNQMKPNNIPQNIKNDAPRASCVNCSLKHIATAITLFQESKLVSPSYRWLAIGELNEASNEMLRDFPEIANEIKEIRLKLMEDGAKIPLLTDILERLDKKFYPQLYINKTNP